MANSSCSIHDLLFDLDRKVSHGHRVIGAARQTSSSSSAASKWRCTEEVIFPTSKICPSRRILESLKGRIFAMTELSG